MTLRKTITTVALHSATDSPIFGESALTITVDDDGGGWFFKIEQCTNENHAHIKLDLEELRLLLEVAEELAQQEEPRIGQ